MINLILNYIDRNNTAFNAIHLATQVIIYAIKGRFSFRSVLASGWKKTSDTLVVIAAGPSVNELSAAEWNAVSQFDTLGLSYGSLTPVQVDAFVCEFAPPSIQPNQIAMFRALSERYAQSPRKPLCIWKHPERVTNTEHLSLPVSRVLTLVIPALSLSTLSKVTDLITRLKLQRWFIFQSAGSISALVMFARAFNYTRVIFIGLDVTDRRYFFEDNPDYAHIGLENPFKLDGQPDVGKTHQVASSFGDIEDFTKRLEIAGGPTMNFFVSSKSSALSRYWPVHLFDTSTAD
ncbi:MAG: hypothetical protein ACE37E_10455 [Hyphomicrobiales bacterium]